ncbi:hypothetical protein CRUP_034932 [Coryphaenoides rupestris]|nr:hypothetical protein CRUP_034932 [Coryphaenoides rupestris]
MGVRVLRWLLKGKKVGFSDFMQKLVSNHQHFHKMKPVDFDYLKCIGKGSFGKVLLAKHRTSGGYYAVKVLQKKIILERKEQTHVMVERSVLLKGLQHPFLVGLHFSFQTTNLLYFVLDYVNGGDLFYHLQKDGFFPEPRAAFYAAEMATALGYLHSISIVYRSWQGHAYSAPMGGLPPFFSCSRAEMFEQIVHAPLKLATGVSSSARSLLTGLLERDCSERLGRSRDFEELQDHAFFVSINWEDLLARKITPPFIPHVAGPCDVRYVDPEFTLQPVPASVGTSDGWQGGGANDTFLGFSYMPPLVYLVEEVLA